MSRNPRDLLARAPRREERRDWFKIVNKAGSDTTEILIYDDIGESWWGGVSAEELVKQLNEIDTPKIDVRINSPGGEIFDGVAIYNGLKRHPAYVTVYVDALAASAASFIAQAGDERVMLRGSTMMIHDGMTFAYGNEAELLKTADTLGKLSNTVADIYARRSGMDDVETWREFMRAEVWYTADEAVDAGLADRVLDIENKDAEEATNKWDLHVFAHAGRQDAPSPDEVRRKVMRFINRAKEATVAQPTMSEQQPETPAAPETQSTPAGAGADGGGQPVPEAPASPASTEQEEESGSTGGAAPEQPAQPSNSAGRLTGVMCNGVLLSDFSAIQRHVTVLETSMREHKQQMRRSFVQSLAEGQDAKIPASAIGELETFALGLDDATYDAWTKSWGFIQSTGLFAQHDGGGNASTSSAVRGGGNDTQTELEDLKAIVAHNRHTMSDDQLKKTSSYIRLQALENKE